jgi:hypothetical protein
VWKERPFTFHNNLFTALQQIQQFQITIPNSEKYITRISNFNAMAVSKEVTIKNIIPLMGLKNLVKDRKRFFSHVEKNA